LNKTKVTVEFSVFGDNFNPDTVTTRLKIHPDEQHYKRDMIPNRNNLYYKETAWCITTGCQESADVNIQLKSMVERLRICKNELIQILGEYHLECSFSIVVEIENHEIPALYLTSLEIAFANDIGAEFDFDYYIYS